MTSDAGVRKFRGALQAPPGAPIPEVTAWAAANPQLVVIGPVAAGPDVTGTPAAEPTHSVETTSWVIQTIKAAQDLAMPLVLPGGLGSLVSLLLDKGLDVVGTLLSGKPYTERYSVADLQAMIDGLVKPEEPTA